MENPEEILHSLEEFSKLRPKSIPRELEDYLCFVAKTGDPVYQWSVIKCLFREKLINVITEFYESCPSVEIPPCRNVDLFNYDMMKTFILEKLDTFVAAPFTVQRICELLTTPRKEYNRIDKYMRALEKNILVVSTTEPGNHRTPENGDGFINGIESDHVQDGSHDINIEEMDDAPVWPPKNDSYQSTSKEEPPMIESVYNNARDNNEPEAATSQATLETVICSPSEEPTFIPVTITAPDIDATPVVTEEKSEIEVQVANEEENTESVPAVVQRRRTSIEPPYDETETPEKHPEPTHPQEEIINPVEMDSEKQLEITLDVEQPQPQEMQEDSETIKEVILDEEPKVEASIANESTININQTDVHASGDDSHVNVLVETLKKEKMPIETVEQAKEIDVTTFVPEDLPAATEIPNESTLEEATSNIQDQLEEPLQPVLLEEPVDIVPPQEPVDEDIHSDTPKAPSVLPEIEDIATSSAETIEVTPTESISMEQKALEQAPEVPEPENLPEAVTPVAEEIQMEIPMEIDVSNDMETAPVETEAVAEAETESETAPEAVVSTDSNN